MRRWRPKGHLLWTGTAPAWVGASAPDTVPSQNDCCAYVTLTVNLTIWSLTYGRRPGGDRLKEALAALGLKTGGTLRQRAERLWLTRGAPLEALDKRHFAKGAAPAALRTPEEVARQAAAAKQAALLEAKARQPIRSPARERSTATCAVQEGLAPSAPRSAASAAGVEKQALQLEAQRRCVLAEQTSCCSSLPASNLFCLSEVLGAGAGAARGAGRRGGERVCQSTLSARPKD